MANPNKAPIVNKNYPTQKDELHEIEITVYGGLIQDIENIPENIRIKVTDLDNDPGEQVYYFHAKAKPATPKKFALYLFDDEKEGWEREKFIEKIETSAPEDKGRELFNLLIGGVDEKRIKVSFIDMPITIHDKRFAGMFSIFVPGNTKSLMMVFRKEDKK